MMTFYTDGHIAIERVKQLRRKGIDVVHSGDVGVSDVPDSTRLPYASTSTLNFPN